MYRILILEDDSTISKSIAAHLNMWGYETGQIEDFQNILPEFISFDPHLVLMDIMLPFFNGYHWCSEIRKLSSVPVIFLSSASEKMNVVMAMNMGGDDFLSKPIELDIMVAKIQAMLRRTYDFSGATPLLSHGDAILNLADSSFRYQNNRIELTKNEFKILQTLMENKGKIISRDTLMIKLWQNDQYVEENTLNVNIARLRKKLEAIGLKDFIQTKVGSGYLIS